MKYCIKHNNNISLCVCKHCPCEKVQEIKELALNLRNKTDYHGEDEVIADIDKILTLTNQVLEKEEENHNGK